MPDIQGSLPAYGAYPWPDIDNFPIREQYYVTRAEVRKTYEREWGEAKARSDAAQQEWVAEVEDCTGDTSYPLPPK